MPAATAFAFLCALSFVFTPDARAASAETKKASVAGDARAGARKAELCLLCHRAADDKPLAAFLAGQPAPYLYEQLKAYKERRRTNIVMNTNAGSLSDRDMRDIAQYFASRPAERASQKVDTEKVAAGKAKAAELGCSACHNEKGRERNIPRIAGQKAAYLLTQLEAFAGGNRPHGTLPPPALQLSRDDAERLAHYFAQLD